VVSGPNGPLCIAITDATGVFSCVPTTPLPEGQTTVTAVATDGAGNTSSAAIATITVDTTPPDVTITSPADGSTTSDHEPTIVGTTEPFATVVVSESNGTTICTATADSSGAWSCEVPASLVDGPHTIIAVATDRVGNEGEPTSSTFVVETPVESGGLSGGALCTVGHGRTDTTALAACLGLLAALLLRRRSRRE